MSNTIFLILVVLIVVMSIGTGIWISERNSKKRKLDNSNTFQIENEDIINPEHINQLIRNFENNIQRQLREQKPGSFY